MVWQLYHLLTSNRIEVCLAKECNVCIIFFFKTQSWRSVDCNSFDLCCHVISLDRISLIIMVFVNYGGGRYWFFRHESWNGEDLLRCLEIPPQKQIPRRTVCSLFHCRPNCCRSGLPLVKKKKIQVSSVISIFMHFLFMFVMVPSARFSFQVCFHNGNIRRTFNQFHAPLRLRPYFTAEESSVEKPAALHYWRPRHQSQLLPGIL